jgi:hypothetical protein
LTGSISDITLILDISLSGVNQILLRRRSSDKPWQWAVLFVIFSILVIPFYCLTRRTWRPLLYTFAGVSSVSLLWGVIIGFLEGFTGKNYQDHSIAEFLLSLGCLAAVYGCGYLSVKHLRDNAWRVSRGDQSLGLREGFQETSSAKEVLIGSEQQGPTKIQGRRIGLNHVFAAIAVIGVLLTAGYAIHTTTVESTIKANPILAAVAKTGSTIKIKHFDCGDLYGYYDSTLDTLQICTAVHDDQLFSSKEATIRHEAWHLVQACSAIKTKDDEWGEFHLVNTPLLTGKSLTPDESKYISDTYEVQDHAIEKEALLAETHLTDGQIIQAIEEKCYLPE